MSVRRKNNHPDWFGAVPPSITQKPAISHFTRDSIVFVDETEIEVDSVILATGYQLRKPFLEAGHALVIDPKANSYNTKTDALASNTHYIFPLHRHIFALSPMYPATALAFVGLPIYIAICSCYTAQSMFIAQMIRDPDLLPSRQQMLHELELQEQESKDLGVDPYVQGHKMPTFEKSSDYQDELLDYLRVKVWSSFQRLRSSPLTFVLGCYCKRWEKVCRGMAQKGLQIYPFETRVGSNRGNGNWR